MGYPGGALFNQLSSGVKDAMVVCAKLVKCQFLTIVQKHAKGRLKQHSLSVRQETIHVHVERRQQVGLGSLERARHEHKKKKSGSGGSLTSDKSRCRLSWYSLVWHLFAQYSTCAFISAHTSSSLSRNACTPRP